MTATGLLAFIVGGVLLQLLGAVAVALRRRSQRLAAMRATTA